MNNEQMEFPNNWEEFEMCYGFYDIKEVYTNNARLIPSFRVKQWLDHLEKKPCEDAISRKAAIEAVMYLCKYYTPTKSVNHPHMDFVIEILQDLPPVTPTQEYVLDKIREDIENHCSLAKENHCKYCSYCNNVMGVREILETIDKYKESEG